MQAGDRVELVQAIGAYSAGCKGIVDYCGPSGLVDVTVDTYETGDPIVPPTPLPPQPENFFK